MDIQCKLVRETKKFLLIIIIITIILNINYSKVNAKINNNLEGYLNDEIYSNSKIHSENIIENIMAAITGKLNAYEIIIDTEVVGYTVIDENFEEVKDIVLNKYIEDEKINRENVIEFDIEGDIKLRENRIEIEKLQTNEELAEILYNLSKEETDKVSINIKYLKEEIRNITPSTIIIPTDTLYIGESKIEEGEEGIKKSTKRFTVESGEIKNEKIVKEYIIKEQVSKKIYRGTKNPYEYGIAFLKSPTRGGYMTSGYGERWNSFHKGIDIAGDIGEEVFAAMDGEVIYSEFNNGGYGNLIILSHEDNMSTYYGHLNDYYVKVGDKIKKGDVIGEIGNTGFSTGPHLHFELRVDDEAVNPVDYIVQ